MKPLVDIQAGGVAFLEVVHDFPGHSFNFPTDCSCGVDMRDVEVISCYIQWTIV